MAVLELGAVKTALGIESTKHDAQLELLMPRAEQYVATRCGPLEPTTVTSRVEGDTNQLILPKGPLLSVTSVTGYSGTLVDPAIYWVDKGMVWSLTEFGEDFYDVVYSIGRAVGECPGDLIDAAANMVRHFWRPNQGPVGGRQGDTKDAMAALRLAQEQMAPYRRRRVLT